jgi:probable H4MPT-linked C1 transfer pathway protein
LIDIGTTTCDIIPIVDGQPAAVGQTDTERLQSGELVYTGVQRSPLCAVINQAPYRGATCRLAQELFATTWDVYLTLGDLPEQPLSTHTANLRPATRTAALDRLARSICADCDIFSESDAKTLAEHAASAQLEAIAAAAECVVKRLPALPQCVVVSGTGEFLARRVVTRLGLDAQVISLGEMLGPELSQCATAHALAVIARGDVQ